MGSGGGVLDGRQRAVDLKSLGEELGARVFDAVIGDAANEEGTRVSAVADTCQIRKERARAAYLIDSRLSLTLSASAMGLVPSGPSSL